MCDVTLNANRLLLLQDDPFWTAHTLTPNEKDLIANQSVCSLEQLLRLASYHNSTVVVRLQRPPPDHPHHHSWINDTLQAVQRSQIPQSLVGAQEVSSFYVFILSLPVLPPSSCHPVFR